MTIIEQLQALNITQYSIAHDGKIIVWQDIDWSYEELEEIPIKIASVKGSMNLQNNNLTSFKNSPSVVWEKFNCSNNKLKSFADGPLQVGSLSCMNNPIMHMDCAPNMTPTALGSIYKDFEGTNIPKEEIEIYECCLQIQCWNAEQTLCENLENLCKKLPSIFNDKNWSLLKQFEHKYRGTSLGDKLGIL